MSWLKSTLSKVRESGEALKQDLREKTSVAAASVKTAVEARKLSTGGRSCSTAADLETQLEQGARNVRKVAGLSEMHKAWLQQVDAGSPKKEGHGYRIEDSDRSLGFKEVLLRSRALEITVETIASDSALRASYSELPSAEDKTSPAACLHALLSKTLSAPVNLWSEVLRLAMCSDGSPCDGHVDWLISSISAMKIDWRIEMLTVERKEMALRAEHLRQELKQLESQSSDESDAMYQRRVAASSELLQTYQAVRRNLEEAQSHRSQTIAAKEKELSHIIEQIQAHMVSLQSSAQTSTERQTQMEGELKQSQDSIQLQLQNMIDARTAIDRELEELEARKQQLRMELDEVSKQLDETRAKQRQHMENCDKQRVELDALKSSVKEKIETESSIIKEADRVRNIIERTQQLVRDTDGVVQRTLGGQLEELQKKQTQFNDHFQELLKEHLVHVEVQLTRLRERAETDAADPQRRAEVAAAASAAAQEFDKFVSEYFDLLKSGEAEAKVQRLKSEHAAVQEMVAPLSPPPASEQAAPPAFEPPPRANGDGDGAAEASATSSTEETIFEAEPSGDAAAAPAKAAVSPDAAPQTIADPAGPSQAASAEAPPAPAEDVAQSASSASAGAQAGEVEDNTWAAGAMDDITPPPRKVSAEALAGTAAVAAASAAPAAAAEAPSQPSPAAVQAPAEAPAGAPAQAPVAAAPAVEPAPAAVEEISAEPAKPIV